MALHETLAVLCLLYFVSNGNVCANTNGYEVDYADAYYNEIPDTEADTTQTPCQSQELSRWDRLFIMMEDSNMRQNMLLQDMEDVLKTDLPSLRREIQQLASGTHTSCAQALEKTCKGIGEQVNLRLDWKFGQLREAAETHQAQQNVTLQQLLDLARNQASRLTKLEGCCLQGAGVGQVVVKPFNAKEQEASGAEQSGLEKVLMATALELQRVQAQLVAVQRAASMSCLPSGCEMALLFPMRTGRIFATVAASMPGSLRSLTVCLWAKTTQTLNRTLLLSYGTQTKPRELQLLLAGPSLVLTVGGESNLVRGPRRVPDGQWGHYCGMWSSEQGLASLWVNGEKVAASAGVAEGHTLPGGGAVLLGQEDNRTGLEGKFDPDVAFAGKITGVNMWNHVLGTERIRQYARHDGSCEPRGDVIGWGVSEILPHGGAQYIT